jgi:hypothetical protein
VNFTVGVHVAENWSARCGYNAIWMNGMALAPNQVNFDGSLMPIDTKSSVFMQGVDVGLEACW